MTHHDLPRCPRTRKASFEDESDARTFLVKVGLGAPAGTPIPHRAYDCPHCDYWHVSQKGMSRRAGKY
ncbi:MULTISPECIES: hypothetical protein [Streptomyces]|uniref:hypothetical protein n=1 Tax=Streptomyces TaxID=1883 RepID=UPI00345C3674